MSIIVKLWKRQEGVTAIEFAMVAPVLFLLMFGIIEFGLMMATQSALEAGVSSTARHFKALARPSSGGGASDNVDSIRSHILSTSSGLVRANGNLRVYANLLGSGSAAWGADSSSVAVGGGRDNYQSGAEANAAAGGNACQGAPRANRLSCSFFSGDVVQYQVAYEYRFHTPLLAQIMESSGINPVLLRASMVVQNEPDIVTR